MFRDWNEYIEDRNHAMGEVAKGGGGETFSAFRKLKQAALKDGAIDAKTKELMIVSIAIATHCDGCIAFHTKAAKDLGATREEIVDTISVAIFMSGGPGTIYGSMALEAYDSY